MSFMEKKIPKRYPTINSILDVDDTVSKWYKGGVENKEIRHQNLKWLIKERCNDTAAEMGRRLNRSPAQIGALVRKERNIGDKLAREIESVFGLEKGWMDAPQEGAKSEPPVSINQKISFVKLVPLISWVAAGKPADVTDHVHPDEYFPCTVRCGRNSYALRVKGDSMSPDYPPGSVIVVDPEKEPGHNSDVVVLLNHDDEATFKRLKYDGSRRILFPLNPLYDKILLDGREYTICGVVVLMMREI